MNYILDPFSNTSQPFKQCQFKDFLKNATTTSKICKTFTIFLPIYELTETVDLTFAAFVAKVVKATELETEEKNETAAEINQKLTL